MSNKKRIFYETEETVTRTKRGYIDMDVDYFQFYSTAFSYVASLSSICSKDFILWIIGRVDEKNEFKYNRNLFALFTKDLSELVKPKKYSESTMYIALMELVEHEILFRIEKGHYKVNPKLFWSVDLNKRIKAVKQLEEAKAIAESKTIGYPLPEHIEQTKQETYDRQAVVVSDELYDSPAS